MLKELGNEIIELFKEGEAKDTQINELKAEVESLKTSVEPLNAKIVELQGQIEVLEQEKEVALQSIQDKEVIINSLNTQTVELQGQIENLTNVINSKNEENRLLNEQTVALQSEKERLQGDLETANNSIAGLNNEIATLRDTVSEKEAIIAEKDVITYEDLKKYLLVCGNEREYSCLDNKSSNIITLNKSELDTSILQNVAGTYTWASPIPNETLTEHSLVQRGCINENENYMDILIYPKGIKFNEPLCRIFTI